MNVSTINWSIVIQEASKVGAATTKVYVNRDETIELWWKINCRSKMQVQQKDFMLHFPENNNLTSEDHLLTSQRMTEQK